MIIKEVVLLTDDLITTEEFYSNILQFPVCHKSEASISFVIGYSILSFTLTTHAKPFYHFACSIPSNRVEEAHNIITTKIGVLPFTAGTTIADFINWNAHAFYFHDHHKNIVEFIAHHDLPNDTDEPFTSSSVIGLCEIGIATQDVGATCEKIKNEYDVPYFVKGPKLSEFCVMGDTKGLFIVTKIGRGWLPRQQPAQSFETTVLFENNGQKAVFKVE